MGLPNVAHLRHALCAAPRRTAPHSSSRVRGRRPPRPPRTHNSHQRATPRAYHLRKTDGWRRPHSRPSEGSWCAAVAAARVALVPGDEARTTASDREARRGARRAESPSDDRVRRCGAPSSTEQRSRRDDRTVRGLREAAEPTSLRHGKRSVAEACAQARRRGQAPWSLGAARGGASPREHTQLSGAAVARRSGARLSGPEESPRAPDPPLGVERRWSLGGQHEHLPGADRASRRHLG